MKQFGRQLMVMGFMLTLSACSLFGKKQETARRGPDPDVVQRFERGMKDLEAERYESAANTFDQLLVTKPSTEFDLITMYNSGAAYEGMGRCQEASERYRAVSRMTIGRYSRIQAEALLRLSYAYECLGENNKVIATLLDLRKRSSFLDNGTAQAEVPARLASAYARAGNRTAADKYFRLASEGIQSMNMELKDHIKRDQLLAQTLYLMGRFNQRDLLGLEDGTEFVRSLAFLQVYLLQSAELGVDPWSKKSAQDILAAYDHVLRIIDRQKAGEDSDPGIAQTKKIKMQRDLTKTAIAALKAFRSLRLPREPGPVIGPLMTELGARERLLEARMASLAESSLLTPEAQKREGISREGKTEGPRTKLEKGRLPKTRKP